MDCQWLDVERNPSPRCEGSFHLVGFIDRNGVLVEQAICAAHLKAAEGYQRFHGAIAYVTGPPSTVVVGGSLSPEEEAYGLGYTDSVPSGYRE